MKVLNNSVFSYLERSLDAVGLRQRVIANNIANVDTPHFKRTEVSFENILHEHLKASPSSQIMGLRTDPRHFHIGQHPESLQPVLEVDEHSYFNNNMNNVDIDSEMALSAKNQLQYETIVQQMNYEIKMLRTAIEGRN